VLVLSYNPAINFRDQRYRQGVSGAECRDDELLGATADFQGLKCGDGHITYRVNISGCLAPANDLDLWIPP